MTDKFSHVVNLVRLWDGLCRVGAEVGGWIVALFTFFCALLAPETYAFAVVGTAIVLDAFFGMLVAFRDNKFLLSKLARETLIKITSYMSCLLVVLMIERLAHDNMSYGVKLAAAWAAACELWSMSASILILKPDSPFFKLVRHQLKGEIAAKVGKTAAEVFVEKAGEEPPKDPQ